MLQITMLEKGPINSAGEGKQCKFYWQIYHCWLHCYKPREIINASTLVKYRVLIECVKSEAQHSAFWNMFVCLKPDSKSLSRPSVRRRGFK